MATVSVSTWAEFVTAVGTSGADVVLPEEAVWDMNEIQPHFNQNLEISCNSITGNGAEIANLHITGYIELSEDCTISNLKMTNILADGAGYYDGSNRGIFAIMGQNVSDVEISFTRCTFTGIFGSGYMTILSGGGYVRLTQTAFNLDMTNGVGWDNGNSVGHVANACRVFLTLPHTTNVHLASGYYPSERAGFNEYVVHAPLAEWVGFDGNSSSTLRGNMQNVTQIQAYSILDTSVFNATDAPSATSSANTLIGVSDSQMKDEAFLRSLGFLIGGT